MNYPAYPEYKDSGIEWLGDIPSRWDIKPMLAIGRESSIPNTRLLETNLLSLSYGRIVPKDIESVDGLLPASFETYQVVHKDDVVFRLTDLQNDKRSLRSGLVGERGIITSAYLAFTPTALVPRFFAYLMRSYDLCKVFYARGGGLRQSLKYDDLKRLPVLVPPPAEQSAIADFLDRETAKIDALIAKQEQLIATLREDRIATITHAVTKGLDPNAEMKDSGVEWLGEIPAGWKVMQLRHTVERIEQGVSPAAHAELADDGWGVLKSGCVNGGVFQEVQHKKLPDGFDVDTNLAVKVGDLLVCRASGSPSLVGSAAIVRTLNYRLILSDKIFRFVLGKRVLPRFLEWELNSRTYREQVTGAISGAEGLANNLPLSSLKAFSVTVPPIPEQRSIVEYLDTHCAKLDALIAKSEQMIGVLREYRSALITDAVTGKIDVRGAA